MGRYTVRCADVYEYVYAEGGRKDALVSLGIREKPNGLTGSVSMANGERFE